MAIIEETPGGEAATLGRLEHRWLDAPGIPGFLTTVDHKRIGMRYIYTSFVFFFIAGLAALVLVAAVLYSSVGHAGATAYLAAMGLFGVPPAAMRPAALVMNMVLVIAGLKLLG